MDELLTRGVTYRVLTSALLTLGFQETVYDTHRRYEKQDVGAVILLPRDIRMEESAHAVHLLTARHTVAGFGIAAEARFEEMLEPPRKEMSSSMSRLAHATVPVEVN